jgi:eukaryotic-like serine/threonine-protein kinase
MHAEDRMDANRERDLAHTEIQDERELITSLDLSLPRDAEAAPGAPSVPGYVLTMRLGAGSYGEVWKAWQIRTRKEVAVKLFTRRSGLDWLFLRREIERLARLDTHPNVVRLLDAELEREPPFYVMDLIRGGTLAELVSRGTRTDFDQVVRWMYDIAHALHFIHGKGLIHCDLKPGNVLIDEEGNIRLTDFGQSRVFNESQATLGTLFFMPPEQAVSVEETPQTHPDVRWDVFSLGATIYTLLSGHPPHGTDQNIQQLHAATTLPERLERYRQMVRQNPLELELAHSRSLKNSELTAIIGKCLAPDPENRYAGATGIIADLDALSSGHPVTPLRNKRVYRARKFVLRNMIAVTASTIVLAALVGGLAVSAVMYVRAESARAATAVERDRAEQQAIIAQEVATFLIRLFEVSDPSEARGSTVTAREILDKGAARIESEMMEQPEIKSALLFTMGDVYQALGLYQPAQRFLEKALEIRRAHQNEDHVAIAGSCNSLGRIYYKTGDYDGAEELFREALERYGSVPTSTSGESIATATNNLALVLQRKGKLGDAESLFREALDLHRAAPSVDKSAVAVTLSNLAGILGDMGRYTEASELYNESIRIQQEVHGEMHPALAATFNNFARMLESQRLFDDAEPLLRKSIEINRNVLGENHPSVAVGLLNLAGILVEKGEYDQAESLYLNVLDAQRQIFGTSHSVVATTTQNLARLYELRGDSDRAERLYRDALATYRDVYGDDHPFVATTMLTLARVVARKGAYIEAEALFRDALEIRRRKFPPQHRNIGAALTGHGSALIGMGRCAEAEAEINEGRNIFVQSIPIGDWKLAEADSLLGDALVCQGRYDQAELLLLDAYERMSTAPGTPPIVLRDAIRRLIKLNDINGNATGADSWRLKLGALEPEPGD